MVVLVVLEKGDAALATLGVPNKVSATPLATPAANMACIALTVALVVVVELGEELPLMLLLLAPTDFLVSLVANNVSSE